MYSILINLVPLRLDLILDVPDLNVVMGQAAKVLLSISHPIRRKALACHLHAPVSVTTVLRFPPPFVLQLHLHTLN